MKRGIIILGICIAVAVLIMFGIQRSTQAQGPGRMGGEGGGRPGGGQFNVSSMILGNVQTSWAGLSFELEGVDDAKLSKARKVYMEEWKELKKMAKDMEAAGGGMGSIQAIRGEADKLKAKRDEKLKDILSSDEMAALAKWEAANQRQMGGRRQRQQR
jgi:hypothetical protein